MASDEENPFKRYRRYMNEECARLDRLGIIVQWAGESIQDEEDESKLNEHPHTGPSYEVLQESKVAYVKLSTCKRMDQYFRNIRNTETRRGTFSAGYLDKLECMLKWTAEERAQVAAQQQERLIVMPKGTPNPDEAAADYMHECAYDTHSSLLMMIYIEKELACIKRMLKKAQSKHNSTPEVSIESSFEELLALTFAVKAVTHWHEDCDDASFNIDIAKLFSSLWNKALLCTDPQLGITPHTREAVMTLLQQLNTQWLAAPAHARDKGFRLRVIDLKRFNKDTLSLRSHYTLA